jgi:signal transduction histidine kinase
MKQFSLTGRILATVIACQLLLVGGLTAVAVVFARDELGRAFDAALEERATSTLALVRYSETDPPVLVFDPELLPPSENANKDLFEIRKMDGQVLAHSEPSPPIDLSATDRYMDFPLNGAPYRAVVLRNTQVLDAEEDSPTPRDRVTVVYASSLVEVRRQIEQLGFSVAGASLLLLALTSAFVTWGLHRRLQPLRNLAASAESISVHNWSFRPPKEAKLAKELLPLTTALETLVTRLEAAFRNQRDFTNDAAHELKTAVAIFKSTIQSLLQRERTAAEYQEGIGKLRDDCRRLEDLLDRMLRLARVDQWAEHGVPANVGITELNSTCEAAMLRIQPLADSRQIQLEFVGAAPAYTRADPADLEVVWVNLLENAVQYSPPGSKVVLRVENGLGATRVSVEDSGPGIPPEQAERIFERFRRGDPSRARGTGGFGLGLAICKALVTAYGGRIEAANRLAAGAEFHVHLPAQP